LLSLNEPDEETIKRALVGISGKDYFLSFGDASRTRKIIFTNENPEANRFRIYEICGKKCSQV